jgi:uncharacterized Zn finger protein
MTRATGVPARGDLPPRPRRVTHGLRLRVRSEPPTGGPGRTLIALLESVIDPAEMAEGLQYARQGQVLSLDVTDGAVSARVQGSEAKPYRTRLTIGAFDVAQWDSIIAAMADEAVYLVKLLENELPDALGPLLASRGLALVPAAPEAIDLSCTCRRSRGCRHAAAVGYLVADALAADPRGALALRGMSADRLIERLRQTRSIRGHGGATAHVDPLIPESMDEPAPLEACMRSFWRAPREAEPAAIAPPPHVPHALLRRLGPSPLSGSFPFSGLLASVYDRVREHAEELRERVERGGP